MPCGNEVLVERDLVVLRTSFPQVRTASLSSVQSVRTAPFLSSLVDKGGPATPLTPSLSLGPSATRRQTPGSRHYEGTGPGPILGSDCPEGLWTPRYGRVSRGTCGRQPVRGGGGEGTSFVACLGSVPTRTPRALTHLGSCAGSEGPRASGLRSGSDSGPLRGDTGRGVQ